MLLPDSRVQASCLVILAAERKKRQAYDQGRAY